jgi:hypothetical protein
LHVTKPVFTGTAQANATVRLFDGTCLANDFGVWSVATSVLAAGTHTITAMTTDLAGNVSAPSAALKVTIMTAARWRPVPQTSWLPPIAGYRAPTTSPT